MSRGGDDPGTDEPRASAAPTAAPTTDEPQPEPSDPDPGTTEEAMQGFVTDYLQTASSDPRAGFDLLTPAFQEQSGGLEGYRGFWGEVTDVNIRRVVADPEALTVSYTYSYEKDGEARTDDVRLQLEKAGDSFRIAGEA
jgi:hypothetical protein